MPDIFFSPYPSLPTHCHDQLQNVSMTLALHYPFFNVQYKRAVMAQYPKKFGRNWQKPFYVLAGRNTAVRLASAVCVRGRSDK